MAGSVVAVREISQTALEEYGRAVRSVHAKSHGLLRGELKVLAGLPPASAQEVFAQTGARPVLLRFSTNPGDILDDNLSTPHGLGSRCSTSRANACPVRRRIRRRISCW